MLVLMCTQNLCFKQKSHKFSSECYQFYRLEKSLYIVWESLGNVSLNKTVLEYRFGGHFYRVPKRVVSKQ